MKEKAIIIGAGIGGLATAIKLAKQGLDVTIFEKNSGPGGRCQQLIREGHVFDTGATMYLFPQIYANFFASIDENIDDYFKLLRVEPIYRLHFSDNSHLTITSDLKKMENQLEKLELGSYQQFLKYLAAGKELYDFGMSRIITKSLSHPTEYFNLKNLYLLLKTKALTNHYAFTQKYFHHPNLGAAFTFQDSYLSLNPFGSPAIYSLFAYSELTEGSYLPQGSMYQVILALVKIAQKNGVKIVYQKPVKKINVSDKTATSITLADGTSETADYLVVNADLTYAYGHLLPPEPYAQKLLKKKYSCSALSFHWALDKVYPELATHNLFFANNYRQGFDDVLNRAEPPAEPHFYLQAPCRTDSSRAPQGHDTLSIVVPINHPEADHPIDWESYREQLRAYIFQRLNQAGLKDLQKHIKFEISYLPTDWQQHLNLTNGAIYGLHHNLTQLGYLRPHRQHHRYKNLFFVGSDTHPGSGLPTVLLSAQFTSQAIIEQKNKENELV